MNAWDMSDMSDVYAERPTGQTVYPAPAGTQGDIPEHKEVCSINGIACECLGKRYAFNQPQLFVRFTRSGMRTWWRADAVHHAEGCPLKTA